MCEIQKEPKFQDCDVISFQLKGFILPYLGDRIYKSYIFNTLSQKKIFGLGTPKKSVKIFFFCFFLQNFEYLSNRNFHRRVRHAKLVMKMQISLRSIRKPNKIQYALNDILNNQYYLNDGLVFTKEKNAPYKTGTNLGTIYSWKSLEQLSLNLYVSIPDQNNNSQQQNKLIAAQQVIPKDSKIKYLFVNGSANVSNEKFKQCLPESIEFDYISSQFSLQYMFDSEYSAQNIFKNMTSTLKDKGLVLLTIPDSLEIKKIQENSKKNNETGKYEYQNSLFSMEFESNSYKQEYGQSYKFFVEESTLMGKKIEETNNLIKVNQNINVQTEKKNFNLDNYLQNNYVTEYVIDYHAFKSLTKQYGLTIIEDKSFNSFYKSYKDEYRSLVQNLELDYNSASKDLLQIGKLYRAIILQFDKYQRGSRKIEKKEDILKQINKYESQIIFQ
ncbi:hypothetical protein PPERSA_11416 [Pseudocohnilembus persalinus]|uniref:mRNA (guanine-N(7))-methyltransferase n=1 Tax=Pseudocohnilembus persalinus TaxID=266149 RepID=A0A0V0QQ17_PSEPJ|nr:hypothetical protein PPERSA_11416 [Pseudocohnilembus persalinus]|eukprot:KRX04292.1 hypothetical protein PPERSA_11416 [Pseudocohnilembus persalinus]